MAAEFSRELGEKVYRGKTRLVKMGYCVGGRALFGLRRRLVSADGTPKQILQLGERKNISTDRVVLVPGPRREVDTVRLMYDLVFKKGYRAQRVTDFLNEMGMTFSDGKRWNRETVDAVLRNPKYTGTNVWGRMTGRLQSSPRRSPRDQWVTQPNAFRGIIDQHTFEQVQKYLNSWWWTDQELLDGLREVWKREGNLNLETLTGTRYSPTPSTIAHHFGSVKKALEMIGYTRPKRAKDGRQKSRFKRMQRALVQQIALKFPERLKVSRRPGSSKIELLMDGKHRIAVLLAHPRCTSHQGYSWKVRTRFDDHEIPVLCCLVSRDGKKITSMLACSGFPHGQQNFTLSPGKPWYDGGKNLVTLNCFCKTMSEIIARRSESYMSERVGNSNRDVRPESGYS